MSVFPEGPHDDAPIRPSETLWQFLSRSSWGRIARARVNIDGYLSLLTDDERAEVLPRLQAGDRRLVDSTITELWALDYLHSAGCGPIEFGPETTTGGTIDLRLQHGNVNIEVHRSSSKDEEFVADRRRESVLATLSRVRTPRFWLHVTMSLGTAAPPIRRQVRSIERWVEDLDWATERAAMEAAPGYYEARSMRIEGPGWHITLRADPRSVDAPETPAIGSVVGGSIPRHGYSSLADMVRDKRRQHRGIEGPLIVALDITDTLLHEDEIEAALYGPLVDDRRGPVPRVYRQRSEGIWGQGTPGDDPEGGPAGEGADTRPDSNAPRQPAAVLTIDHLNIARPEVAEVTLWLPPGAPSPLPPGPWRVRTLK